jgi:hypothetical protein
MVGSTWLWKWAVVDVRGLAAFRIAVGVIVLADALLRSRDLALMFAPDGIFPPDQMRAALGGPSAWSLAWLDDSLPWGRCLLVLEGLSGLALACGWHTRPTTIVAWIVVVSIVRRTAPATNAGDQWLGCLLLWGCFLPLGAAWSVDARRRPGRPRSAGHDVVTAASAALVLQIAFVYFSAGLAKCNAVWFAGDAVTHVLSVHDHGTRLGQWVAEYPWLTAPAGWALVVTELAAAPLLVAWPACRARGVLAGLFILLHATIWLLLSVGLFAPVGIAAWLAVVPGCVWDRLEGPAKDTAPPIPAARPAGLAGCGHTACCTSRKRCRERSSREKRSVSSGHRPWMDFGHGLLAGCGHTACCTSRKRCRERSSREKRSVSSGRRPGMDFGHGLLVAWLRQTLLVGLMIIAAASAAAALRSDGTNAPGWLRLAVRLTALEQEWEMFGDVRRQAQWVQAVATLADGSTVDLLRGGVSCGDGLPDGGYLTLPHHRWHKLCWDLHRPVQRRFAPSLAAALAREWNRCHPAAAQARSVEIRNGRLRADTSEEILLGSWPVRAAGTGGNLDRFLRDRPPEPDLDPALEEQSP